MPHVHGVAWIDEKWLKEFGIDGDLLDHPDKATELADKLISCQLPESGDLKNVVREVQTHCHTKSCQKFGDGICRYGYPRLPSPKTIIAQPLSDEMDEKEKDKLLKEATECLSKAKEILEHPIADSLDFEEFLATLGVSEEQYMKYISISKRGKILILKRDVNERFINNYNIEMLTAWNANMDIQLALDPYAVITYIVNYVSKDESGMTKNLLDTLRAKAKGLLAEIISALQKTFLTRRQNGLSEAVYKTLPEFRLKNSNVTCIYIASGFPDNRSVFFTKVSDDELVEVSDDEEENDGEDEAPIYKPKPTKIEGRAGTWQQATTVIDRYALRPTKLENICLAQFAIWYTYTKKVSKGAEFDEDGNCTNIEAAVKPKVFHSDTILPRYISLKEPLTGFLRLRGYPSVMRIHNSKKKEGHERQYSEMLLFSPWRDEVHEFHRYDAEACIREFEQRKQVIDQNRKMIYPGEPTLDTLSSNLFDNEALHEKPSHIYDTLNPQGEQDQEDIREEGEAIDPAYESFGYFGNLDLNQNENTSSDDFKHKRIDLPEEEELLFLTRRLVPEQMTILNRVVTTCRERIKHHFKSRQFQEGMQEILTTKIKPLRIIIHGGSGNL